jgi:hypothetical protein
MPGKPRFAALHRQMLRRYPVLHLGTKSRHDRLSDEEYLAFFKAVAFGLFERIRLRNDKEADALGKAIDHWESWFSYETRTIGIQKATAMIVPLIARSSTPNLKQVVRPSPIRLSEEASELNSALSQIDELKKRKRWVIDQGLPAESAQEKDADLIERILGNRHHISPSRVHKMLAQAHKLSR